MSLFEREILEWYSHNKRDLPWRTTDAWGVLVSEFMLQQTPVVRVLPKWHEWMDRWPTPQSLANATSAEVITAWGRLGYPRRALRLHECAKIITDEFAGEVPASEEVLRSLPGVGSYTAAAIASFAFAAQTLVLDINIRRLFSRVIDGVDSPPASISKAEQAARAALLPEDEAHTWAAATMELGALVCTARNPKCDQCPVVSVCAWSAAGFPPSTQKRKVQSWHGTDRQCRGVIVQALRENAALSLDEVRQLWPDGSQVSRALASLLSDGLISHTDKALYALP